MCWVRWVARGGVSLAALPPCLLCLCRSLCPSLPQPSLLSHLSSVPCPLGPKQAGPGHAWSSTHCQLCSDATARLQVEGLAMLQPTLPGARWALPPAAQGAGGLGWGPALTQVSGSCPPAADALQTHNTVFQEHAAPSSPGAAPAPRGFRRASEISIASQVSGMAESYTASSIAQSECCGGLPSLHPPVCHSKGVYALPLCPSPGPTSPQGGWWCLETAGEGITGKRWLVTGVSSTPTTAPNVQRGPWTEGVFEGVAQQGQVQAGGDGPGRRGPSPGSGWAGGSGDILPEEEAVGCFWTSSPTPTSQRAAEGSQGGKTSAWPPSLLGFSEASQQLQAEPRSAPCRGPGPAAPSVLPDHVTGCLWLHLS